MAKSRQTVDLDEFLNKEVYPALYQHLDLAFPEFGWKQRGRHWVATEETATRQLPGSPRPDRVYCYENRPWGIVIQGGEFVRWLRHVNGGSNPSGPDFVDAVRRLADLAKIQFPDREVSLEEIERLRSRNARRSVLDVAIAYFQEILFSDRGKAVLTYLAGRGLTEEMVRNLGLGLYPKQTEVTQILQRAGLEPDAIHGSGILWSKLEGYILFPWGDAAGQPQTLYGRWPGEDWREQGILKTTALPGEGTKASPLYFDRARRAGHKDLILVPVPGRNCPGLKSRRSSGTGWSGSRYAWTRTELGRPGRWPALIP
jgi:hypothetical protein